MTKEQEENQTTSQPSDENQEGQNNEQEQKETTETTEQTEKKESPSDEELQKQELERIRKEKAATRAAYEARQEDKEGKRQSVDESDDPIMERLDEMQKGFEQRFQTFEQKQTQAKRDELVGQYSENETDADLTRYHLENSIQSTGNLEEDVANAHALANRHRLKSLTNEMKRSQNSKSTAGNNTANDAQTKPKGKEPQLSQDEAQLQARLKEQGYDVDLSE